MPCRLVNVERAEVSVSICIDPTGTRLQVLARTLSRARVDLVCVYTSPIAHQLGEDRAVVAGARTDVHYDVAGFDVGPGEQHGVQAGQPCGNPGCEPDSDVLIDERCVVGGSRRSVLADDPRTGPQKAMSLNAAEHVEKALVMWASSTSDHNLCVDFAEISKPVHRGTIARRATEHARRAVALRQREPGPWRNAERMGRAGACD